MATKCPFCMGGTTAHTWRFRFAWLPVQRWYITSEGYVLRGGYYFWRPLYEVKVGLLSEWTAYARHNDPS